MSERVPGAVMGFVNSRETARFHYDWKARDEDARISPRPFPVPGLLLPLFPSKSTGPRKIRLAGAVKRASRRKLRPVYTHKAIIYLILSCNTL